MWFINHAKKKGKEERENVRTTVGKANQTSWPNVMPIIFPS